MARVAESGIKDVFSFIDARDYARLGAYLVAHPEAAAVRNAQNVSALMYALYRRNHESVRMLRDRLLTLDLWEAAALGEDPALRALLDEPGCDVEAFSPDGLTALQLASFFGRLGAVELLLERGANPDAVSRNAQGIRALHGATVGRHYEIVRRLMAAGAKLDAAGADGQTALDIAIKSKDEPLVKILTNQS